MVKPINVYVIPPGPNPWKVIIILEELGIPYEMKILGYAEVKSEPYVSINPNGRVPAIEDPNTGITIWESGAIVEYLVDQYDKEEKISYSSLPEKYYLKQWLHFQMSGQGPYFGQAAWLFPSAVTVLSGHLLIFYKVQPISPREDPKCTRAVRS
jgi:glutathione S-transferase